MKQFRKAILWMMCVGVMFIGTACSSNDTAQKDTTTESKNDGMLENAGEDIKEGAKDLKEDMTVPNDTMTENGGKPAQ